MLVPRDGRYEVPRRLRSVVPEIIPAKPNDDRIPRPLDRLLNDPQTIHEATEITLGRRTVPITEQYPDLSRLTGDDARFEEIPLFGEDRGEEGRFPW